MKIMFCIKSLNAPGGGAERVLSEVVSGLVGRGWVVQVVTFDQTISPFYEFPSSVEPIGIDAGKSTQQTSLRDSFSRIVCLRKTIKRLRPDVLVGFMNSSYVLMGVAALGMRIPIIASEHIIPFHYRNRPVEALLLRITPWLVERIAVVSAQAKSLYSPALQKKMVVLHNPVNLKHLFRNPESDPIQKDPVMLAVGRLEPQKDHATLIESFALIYRKFPNWRLRIVGDGTLRSSLEKRIEQLGLQRVIDLPGFSHQIHQEYHKARLFVMPSRYESFGLTVAEALMYHLPVVGFEDCVGVNSMVVHGKNGLLISSVDNRVENLAKGLEYLLSNPGKIDAMSLPHDFTEHSLEAVLDQWEELLRSLVADKSLS